MAVTRPVIFTSVADAEVTRNRPVSEETVRKMIQNANMLAALAPVCTIRCVALNQPGVSAPNSDIWQLANASQITQPQSPITSVGPFNKYTPDFVNIYPRGAADAVNNNTGGSPTVDLSHTHSIGGVGAGAFGEEGGEQKAYTGGHAHGMANDLSSAEPLDPAHQQVAIFMKIN